MTSRRNYYGYCALFLAIIPFCRGENFNNNTEGIDARNLSIPHYLVTYVFSGSTYGSWLNVWETNNGSMRYSGATVDLLNAMSRIGKFTYSFVRQPDNLQGWPINDGSGKWKGMVGSLMDGTADIGAGWFRITADRERVIDYTIPLYQLTYGVLVNKDYTTEKAVNGRIKYLVVSGGYGYAALQQVSYKVSRPAPSKSVQAKNDTRLKHIHNSFETNTREDSYVLSYGEGVYKVLSGGPYGLIMPSDAINAAVLKYREMQLKQTDDVIGTGYIAFGVKQGSPLREKLSWCIETLMENGAYQRIFHRHNLRIPR